MTNKLNKFFKHIENNNYQAINNQVIETFDDSHIPASKMRVKDMHDIDIVRMVKPVRSFYKNGGKMLAMLGQVKLNNEIQNVFIYCDEKGCMSQSAWLI